MNLEFLKPQNLGSLLMKSSQSNFNLRSPSSYLACSYLIATVTIMQIPSEIFPPLKRINASSCYVLKWNYHETIQWGTKTTACRSLYFTVFDGTELPDCSKRTIIFCFFLHFSRLVKSFSFFLYTNNTRGAQMVSISDHLYITSAYGLGGFRKCTFLLTFSTVFLLT